MNFGQALELLKQGKKIAREGWNGKGMHVETVNFTCSNGIKIDNIGMVIKTPVGNYNNWIPSITDLFAEDWEKVVPISYELVENSAKAETEKIMQEIENRHKCSQM